MAWLLVEGDGATTSTITTTAITSQEVTSYQAAAAIPTAERTATQQGIVDTVEEKIASISSGWSAAQAANQATVLAYAADIQAAMTRVIRNYAPKGNERAFTEMFSIVTRELINLKREIIDLQNP